MIKPGKEWFKASWPPCLVIVMLFVGWHLYVTAFDIEPWYIPGPYDVWKEATVGYSTVWSHTLATLQIVALGFLSGAATGIAGALIMHALPVLKRAFHPLVVLSQNIPVIILAMLLPFWLGWGMAPKVVIVLLVCFFPILIAMLNGLQQTDDIMKHYMNMIGASRWQMLWKLEFPFSLPYLFAGLKISATYAVMGAVIAEWLGSAKGIGKYMMLSYGSFRMDRVFLSVVVIVALSLLLFMCIDRLERWIVRWRPEQPRSRESIL